MEKKQTRDDRSARRQDELELARAAARGDRRARQRLATELYGRVRATVRFLSGDHRDQDDWVQQVVVEVLRSVGSFRGESSLYTWANRITIRHTMRLLKRRKAGDQRQIWSEQPLEYCGAVKDSDQRHLVRRQLARVLETLSPKYREVIVLSSVHGYDVDEIAEIVGSPRNTVRQRLRRGRRKLRDKLQRDPVFDGWVKSRKR